ncbi:MAG: hypothetical protein H6917_18710 [Novosphingobium sp.]|nr:hypothetical protein [Novosphingobium sp.]MCP5404410.1 hypothetical protein [Novosphingobium sp.]
MSEGWQGALACIQSLGRRGHHIYTLAGSEVSINSRSSHVRGVARHSGPRGLGSHANFVMKLVEKHRLDLVIPVSDGDARILARCRTLSGDVERYGVSDEDAVDVAISRNRTVELCRKLDIATPRTSFATMENAMSACQEIGFPCYLKVSGTTASRGVFLLKSQADLRERLGILSRNAEFQIQEAVDGELVGVTGFCLDGELLAGFSFQSLRGTAQGGTSPHAVIVEDAGLLDALRRIAGALAWTGGIDLDFIATPDGGHVLLEINPRLSGTAIFGLKRGIDLPAGYLPWSRSAADLECQPEDADATGYVSLVEEARSIANGGAEMVARSADFRREHACVDNAFWGDPGYSRALFHAVWNISFASTAPADPH